MASSKVPVKGENQHHFGCCSVTGDSFIRTHLRKLSPYQTILPFEVFEALGSMKFPHIYPDPEYHRLRAALAEDSGIGAEYIFVGCGADELVDLIMRFVLGPGDKIVECPQTFAMYEFDAAVNAALVIKVPRKSDLSLNVEKIGEVLEQEKPKCIFLTSTNNPDGSIINGETLLKMLCQYWLCWMKPTLNFLELSLGLAGLRVGYGAFPLSIIEYLWRAKQPYNVSAAAEISTCAALKNPVYLENVKVALLQERERLFKLLKEMDFVGSRFATTITKNCLVMFVFLWGSPSTRMP